MLLGHLTCRTNENASSVNNGRFRGNSMARTTERNNACGDCAPYVHVPKELAEVLSTSAVNIEYCVETGVSVE